ncbi:acyl carrier protein [Aliiglaciecola sp. NS0011-25]|uniref:acyl carrier protein n=1 Tax=Aliiglaciecola sp. NS0011-25 TaxID=3127654 RepID=UPI00310241C0
MNNQQLVKQAFADSLAISLEKVSDDLAYNSIPEWDSTAHMILIAELENQFNVMLDTDDIIDMSSVAKAKEILAKYEIEFDA